MHGFWANEPWIIKCKSDFNFFFCIAPCSVASDFEALGESIEKKDCYLEKCVIISFLKMFYIT